MHLVGRERRCLYASSVLMTKTDDRRGRIGVDYRLFDYDLLHVNVICSLVNISHQLFYSSIVDNTFIVCLLYWSKSCLSLSLSLILSLFLPSSICSHKHTQTKTYTCLFSTFSIIMKSTLSMRSIFLVSVWIIPAVTITITMYTHNDRISLCIMAW